MTLSRSLNRRPPARAGSSKSLRRKRRAGCRIGGRNLQKFIPTSDSDFALVAGVFAASLAADPGGYGVTAETVAAVDAAATAFRAALAKALHAFSRTQQTVILKDQARRKAETVIRQTANVIRANPDVSAAKKAALRIREKPVKLSPRVCPRTPPVLQFIGSRDGVKHEAGQGNGCGVHVLKFFALDQDGLKGTGALRRAKPEGAARLELFVGLVPPGEPPPTCPAEAVKAGRGWPIYLRSFTRSPIEVEFPMPSQPMLIVYWARWADATGEVGRFSKTCVARVEGWSAHAAHALPEGTEARRVETKYVIVHAPYLLADRQEDDDDAAAPARHSLDSVVSGGSPRRLPAA